MGRQSVIFGPVLDKISHHELFVEDKDWEVKLFPIVKSDMLLDNFWELMNFLTQFDTFFSNHTIDGHHAVLLRLVDQLNFLDSFDLFGKLLIALSAHLSQLLAVGTLKRCISDEFRGFVPLFYEESRLNENNPALFLATLTFISLQAVFLGLTILSSDNVKLSTTKVKLKFILNVTSLLLESLVKAMQGFLEVFLFVLTCLEQ